MCSYMMWLKSLRKSRKFDFITFQKQIANKTQKTVSYNNVTINDKKQEYYGKQHF